MDDEEDSLPYIDDTTDDETSNHYNLKIIENYQNKNRNIEITNASPGEVRNGPVSPVAPLADEDELGDFKSEGSVKRPAKYSPDGMKLVIKSWNSSVSIQGLDNKSSITFRRKPEKTQKRTSRSEERKSKSEDEVKSSGKPRKGRWKLLTRSLMLTRTPRAERRALDERYPKYVLLKNEEDDLPKVKESYPKMFAFGGNENVEPKPEFSFKRSFKNKTKPIVPMEEILKENNPRIEPGGLKKPTKKVIERRVTGKRAERRKSLSSEKLAAQDGRQEHACPQGHVFREIQGIIEDTLKLVPPSVERLQEELNCPQGKPVEYCMPPPFCQFSCHDPYCSVGHVPPPSNMPGSVQQSRPRQAYGNVNAESQSSTHRARETDAERFEAGADLRHLQFGLLSSFFPKVLILKAIEAQGLADEVELTEEGDRDPVSLNEAKAEEKEEYAKPLETLEVPQQDLTLKSKMVQDAMVTDPEVDFYLGNLSKRDVGADEDQKTKTDESDTTEYLHYCEFDPPDNESVDRGKISTPESPPYEAKDKNASIVDKTEDDNSKNLSLTKIGYKMYDNLTKLSLNREKEITEKAEVRGCGCDGNKAKKLPYNITLESNNNVVRVTVPENELNFQIVNSEGADILIGVTSGENKSEKKEEQEKKIVRRDELWHSDGGKRAVVLRQRQEDENVSAEGSQKLRVSLAENKEVLLSIEMNEKSKKEEKMKPKSTKETKVGTDDFDLAGGDFICTRGESYKNLSPRTAELLKTLQEKLKIGEQERKFLEEKISQKITDEKYESKILPGLFLVKQVSPRAQVCRKPLQIPPARKVKKETGRPLREYYCEDCLATMRMFEDTNPSVKSMVDKFETIIQLESY